MAYDIRNVRNITDLITYFSQNLNWDIDIDDFDTIEDVSYPLKQYFKLLNCYILEFVISTIWID